ncbi:MAG: hypothetical protein IKH44_01410 [Bacteroidales bacterium]|nr:hypothetical protein [Bacteroidales bacterium]
MPTKITIDYEPGKVQGFLIPKDQIIDPKPWPTDDIEGGEAFANESEEPKVFTKSFTFKMSEKANREFKRFMKRSSKLPRKLKKALKHVCFFRLPMERVETENGVAFKQTFGFGPKDGYPCTKWVNRACLKLKANAIYIIERQFSAENYKQRGPHSYIVPTTSNLITHNRTTEQLKTQN